MWLPNYTCYKIALIHLSAPTPYSHTFTTDNFLGFDSKEQNWTPLKPLRWRSVFGQALVEVSI